MTTFLDKLSKGNSAKISVQFLLLLKVSPQGERGLVLRPGLAKRPGGRGGKKP